MPETIVIDPKGDVILIVWQIADHVPLRDWRDLQRLPSYAALTTYSETRSNCLKATKAQNKDAIRNENTTSGDNDSINTSGYSWETETQTEEVENEEMDFGMSV
jgi:hypothetical protein